MKIKKSGQGWTVEPSTSDERKALAFFFEALEEHYGKAAIIEDSSQAKRSQFSDHSPRMASSE
jgi:hypothetical protein